MAFNCKKHQQLQVRAEESGDWSAFNLHLAGCPACRRAEAQQEELHRLGPAILAELAAEGVEPSPAGARPSVGNKWRTFVADLVAPIHGWVTHNARRMQPLIASLVVATMGGVGVRSVYAPWLLRRVAEHRGLPARLTVVAGGEVKPRNIMAPEPSPESSSPLDALLLELLDARSQAGFYLLTDRPQHAIKLLEAQPRSAEVEADLAAAYLADSNPRSAIEVLEELRYRPDPRPEAAWNRGLALEQLNLPLAAAKAFEHAAELSKDESWKASAERRAAQGRRLQAQISGWEAARSKLYEAALSDGDWSSASVREFPDLTRLFLYEQLNCATTEAGARKALARIREFSVEFEDGEAWADFASKVVESDWAVRGPLGREYCRVAHRDRTDHEGLRAFIEDPRLAAFPALRLGAMLRASTHKVSFDAEIPRVDGDVWLHAVSAQIEGTVARTHGDAAHALQVYAEAEARARGAGLQYRRVELLRRMGSIHLDHHDLAAARAAFEVAGHVAAISHLWTHAYKVLRDQARLAKVERDFGFMTAIYEEMRLRRGGDASDDADSAQEKIAMSWVFRANARRAVDALEDTRRLSTEGAWALIDAHRLVGGPEVLPLSDLVERLEEDWQTKSNIPNDPLVRMLEARWALTRATEEGQDVQDALHTLESLADQLKTETHYEAEKARAHSLMTIASWAAEAGRPDAFLRTTAKILGVDSPTRCALALAIDDDRQATAWAGSDGTLDSNFVRGGTVLQPLPVDELVPEAALEALVECTSIDVLAPPPLFGRIKPLPDTHPWHFVIGAPPGHAHQTQPERLVVVDPRLPPYGGLDEARVVLATRMSRDRLFRLMAQHRDLEILLHGSPEGPGLLVANDELQDATLTPADIRAYSLSLARDTVVFLGSCYQARPQLDLHRVESIPATLLKSGASTVFASRAPLEATEITRLFAVVREEMARGQAPAAALARARARTGVTHDVFLFEARARTE